MAGLKICTRWRAISARRKRRINSSLLPENIGPTTTSIQPMLPFTISTLAPPSLATKIDWCPPLRVHRLPQAAIHFSAIKRSEGGDDGNSNGLLARDQIARQNAPGALRIADAACTGQGVDGDTQFDALFENFVGQSFGNLHAARTPIVADAATADVG